jgi:predicted NBD/HSP70 family sugar kinase
MVSVHERNRSKILQTLFLHAPVSRIEIASIMSLTPPTITSNIAALIDAGIIEELADTAENSEASRETALGRKPILLDIVPTSFYALGADWGPTGIICSLTDLRGHQIDRMKMKNEKWEPASTITKTVKIIKTLIERNKLSKEHILGLGVGIPGFVETETGLVRYSPAHGWQNMDVARPLQEELGLDVVIENNVRIMSVGEMLFFQRKYRPATGNFLYIFVGQGIACSIVNNNELLRGNVFGAGELGHTTVALNGPKCRCGKNGCLEAISSEFAIVNRVITLLASDKDTLLKKTVKNHQAPKISEILAAYDQGDPAAVELLSECSEYLGVGVANVINLMNPRLVIFDGQLFENRTFCEKLQEGINNHTFALMKSETEFAFKKYNEDFCSLGAAACAIKKFLF